MQKLEIHAENIGKRFGREWVFRDFSNTFNDQRSYAILGNNGSGKSTLLLALSGYYRLSRGKINWSIKDQRIPEDQLFQYYALSSPLLQLPEELTITEFWEKHFSLKKRKADWPIERLFELSRLGAARNKYLKQLSSGMLQRVKLMATFAADVPVIFLDEPCTNLDQKGIDLYQTCIESCADQMIFIASNMEIEYGFTSDRIQIEDYKPGRG